jgi:uncharacterized membrane protein YfcA
MVISTVVLWYSGMVLVLAYLIRGVTGFGSSLISVPLLAIFMPIPLIIPIVSALDCITSVVHAGCGRRFAAWGELLPLLPFVAAGLVVALYILKVADPLLLKRLLGAFVLVYGVGQLLRKKDYGRGSRRWAALMGSLAGVTNGLFAIGGPFYVMYLHLRRLDKQQFRATFAAVAVLDTGVRTSGYLYSGLMKENELLLLAGALPLTLVALFLGGRIHTRITERTFSNCMAVLLIVSGLLLLTH